MTIEKTCPDCGVGIGIPHLSDCDVALCPSCGQQRITCDCQKKGESIWTGEWPSCEPGDDSDVAVPIEGTTEERMQAMKRTIKMFGQDIEIPEGTEIVGPVVDPVSESLQVLEEIEDWGDDEIDPKLNEWLDEADRIARLHEDYYFNPHLGYPKYGNGLDHLYPEMSPQQALDWWEKYESEEGDQ